MRTKKDQVLTSEWVSVATYRVSNKPNSCIRGTTYHNERANGIEEKQTEIASKDMHPDRKQKKKKKKENIIVEAEWRPGVMPTPVNNIAAEYIPPDNDELEMLPKRKKATVLWYKTDQDNGANKVNYC